MIRIIGIDPGSIRTGFGILDSDGVRSRYVMSGCILVKGESMAERLGFIFSSLNEVIAEWQPREMAIEQVFVNKNADSALKLGQARGVAICAGVQHRLSVSEYAPKQIKSAVVGTGGARKEQVQHMMNLLLNINRDLQADEADALGVALCHAHHRGQLYRAQPQAAQKIILPTRSRKSTRGSWQAWLVNK
jgi:crossover junction endodeoxyribonuclease RuvC